MAEMREKLMHFLNIGSTSTPSYVLLGDGITSLAEEFNPETETKQYINQQNGSAQVKSYAPSISVDKEYIKGEELQAWLDVKVRELPVGSEAETDYIRVNIFETTSTSGSYKAVKRKCCFAINSTGGDAGSAIIDSFSLNGIGDGIQGKFTVGTKTFTAD